MAKLIGTAGHVDHGKTTLIKALTGIDADRLPEEKKRGMTIDIGFAYIDFPSIGRVSIVDVPGHERFIHNMLAGALGVDVALLCVAADEGVKPQTVEHLQILNLLPVEKMVVALTRSDLASSDQLAETRAQVDAEVSGTKFEGSPIITVSAVTGQGLDQLLNALESNLLLEPGVQPLTRPSSPGAPATSRMSDTSRPRDVTALPWYLPIDRVFSVKGHGCVVTGTLARSEVKVGGAAVIEPGHIETRVRSIQSHDISLEKGEPGRRIALNLAGVKAEDLQRGQAVGGPGALFTTLAFDAETNWLVQPKHGERVRVSMGAHEVIGKVFLGREAGELAQFRLEEQIACARGEPFIIRRYSPPDLMCGGIVKVPQAKARGRLAVPSEPREASNEGRILGVLQSQPLGVATEEVCRQLGETPQALGKVFEELSAKGDALGFAGLWFSKENWETSTEKFLRALEEAHRANPMKAYLPREAIASSARLPWAGKPLDRIVAALVAGSKLKANGTLIKSNEFKVALNQRQRELLDRSVAELDKNGVNAPSPREVAETLRVPVQAVEEIIKLGLESGELVRVFEGIYYTPERLAELGLEVKRRFEGRQFTPGEFRDAFQTSRRIAIPLLEYFDRVGITLRVGEKRVLR